MPSLHPGPWQPAPPRQTRTVTPVQGGEAVSYVDSAQNTPIGPDLFPTQCEPARTPTSGIPGSPSDVADQLLHIQHDTFTVGGTTYEEWALSQVILDADLTSRLTPFYAGAWSPPRPWPVHALDWEYDPASIDPAISTVSWLLSWDLKISAAIAALNDDATHTGQPESDVTVIVTPVDPTTLSYNGSGFAYTQPVPGADLTTIIGTTTMTAGQATAAITTSQFDRTWLHVASTAGGTAYLRLALSFDNMRTHVALTADGERRLIVDPAVTYTLDWQPPRWRFLFDQVPPLRQYPRDDALGGAPRQGKTSQSRSVQASARQGWQNAYR